MENKIKARFNVKQIGFDSNSVTKNLDDNTIFENVLPDDLRKFGIIPELVGRFPVITALNSLDKDALIRILTEPKNAIIKQYKKLFEMDDVELVFDKNSINEIAELALKRKIGARGLKSIVETTLLDYMYEIPSQKEINKVKITKKIVDEKNKIGN